MSIEDAIKASIKAAFKEWLAEHSSQILRIVAEDLKREATTTKMATNNLDIKETYTVMEAAKILRISRNKAYTAASTGDLPTIRFGKKLLVPKLALERMLNQAG